MTNLIKEFVKLLLKEEHRAVLEMGSHIFNNVATSEQRDKITNLIQEILKDGKITEEEWKKLGSKQGLNIIKKAD
jgi:polyhydroxyalkanoate synthesis regulator phasin